MKYFGIQEGLFTGQLNVGLLNEAKTEFLAGEDIIDPDDGELVADIAEYLSRLRHEDCTDMAIRAVAEHIIKHYGGGLVIDYNDGTKYEIQVNKVGAAAE